MAVQLKNNVSGFLANSISATDTSIVLQAGQGITFPTLGTSQYFYATIVDTAGNLEIVKATARAGDTLTVLRGQDDTAARAFPALSRIELRVNAGTIYEVIDASISSTPLVISNIASVIRVAEDIDAVKTVSDNIEDVNTVADNITDVNLVADNMPLVVAVGVNLENLQAVADNETNINLVAGNETNINIVAADIEEVVATGTYITNVNTVADDLNDPNSNIKIVAANIDNVNLVGEDIANVNLVGEDIANVNTVADDIANVNIVAADIADVSTVAGIAADVSAVAAIDDKVVIAADNVADITNFADVYYGPNATDPTTRKNGDPLQKGDMYYNTALDQLEIYNGVAFDPLPAASVARTFYVTMDGSDGNSGNSLNFPLATIGQAVTNMATLAPLPCVTVVHPGEYTVQPNTVVPANCALYGYDLRVTKLSLPSGQEQNNMFQLSNGCKVRGFTFTNLQHEGPPEYADVATGNAAVEDYGYFRVTGSATLYKKDGVTSTPVTYDYPPKKGFAFVFKPGELLTRSPYIADCSQLHNFTQAQMSLPIDREAGNPLMPRGGGNLRADGSVLAPSSPLRSVVVDSFTAINPNGYGYLVTRNALVQLVSVFTNWSRFAIWAHDGGQVTVSNSNITFGDYGLVATGLRRVVQIPNPTGQPRGVYTAAANLIDANATTIIDEMYTQLEAEFPAVASFTPEQEAFTRRDAATFIRELTGDLRSGQDRGAQTFVKGLFDWNAAYYFDDSLLLAFTRSFSIMLNRMEALGGAVLDAVPMLNSLVSLVSTNLITPQRTTFVSVVESNGHQFSYSGSGVNYNALPYAQRGTGEAPDPATTIVQLNGGRVYATFTTERGDSYLGSDLRVDFQRNTIEGQAFSRGVQNITLPLTIALGG
jgi:hypothetical protein